MEVVVADAGNDSEANHRVARLDLGVRSVIPPDAGRPRKDGSPPATLFRRLMRHRFARKADRHLYGQRWQAETVNSMVKRNLGPALRARTDQRRECEMLLRAVTHNVMLLRAPTGGGSRQSSPNVVITCNRQWESRNGSACGVMLATQVLRRRSHHAIMTMRAGPLDEPCSDRRRTRGHEQFNEEATARAD